VPSIYVFSIFVFSTSKYGCQSSAALRSQGRELYLRLYLLSYALLPLPVVCAIMCSLYVFSIYVFSIHVFSTYAPLPLPIVCAMQMRQGWQAEEEEDGCKSGSAATDTITNTRICTSTSVRAGSVSPLRAVLPYMGSRAPHGRSVFLLMN
jgi:hypothetical protein